MNQTQLHETYHVEAMGYLRALRLRQYPPQKRTMRFRVVPPSERPGPLNPVGLPRGPLHYEVRTISFPWMSFGGTYIRRFSESISYFPTVFIHEKPWHDADEAARYGFLKFVPAMLHGTTSYGMVCMGTDVTNMLYQKEISVEDAFWFTTNQIRDGVDHIDEQLENDILSLGDSANLFRVYANARPLGIIPPNVKVIT